MASEQSKLKLMDFLPELPSTPQGKGGRSIMPRDEQERYLLSLLSFGLDRVSAEPDRLASEIESVKKETEAHAVNNYSAFLQSAVCVRNVREELEHSGRLLHQVAAEVSQLKHACSLVTDKAHKIEEARNSIQVTSQQHSQLLELLEVPQLMDTAVRNEYYEEALELAEFASKLAARHSSIALVASVQKSVENSQRSMQQQLLLKLQSNIQLPVCLQVIGVLRRLGRHSEEELRWMFLSCRDSWLQSALNQVVGNHSLSSYQQLCKIIDIVRMHTFEIVTQYRAIFLDYISGQEENVEADGGLLFAWANRRITSASELMAVGLSKIKEGGQIASLLEKVMYCGAYLGREGLDFRGVVTSLFETRVLALAKHGMAVAREHYEGMLSNRKQLVSLMPDSLKARYEEGADGTISPPAALLDYPPLIVLCNKVLDVYNDLREVAILSLRRLIGMELAALLLACASSAAGLFAELESTVSKDERVQLLGMIRAMNKALIPFLASAHQTVFGAPEHGLDLSTVSQPLREVLEVEEEAERKLAEAAARRQAEEAARRRAAEEAKRAEEEAQRRKLEEEQAEQERIAEEEKQRAEAERTKAEEEARRNEAEEEARRDEAEEEARRDEAEEEEVAAAAAEQPVDMPAEDET